ncbi:MAG: DUF4833 domain-containing protein [Bacteroidota bacterium]
MNRLFFTGLFLTLVVTCLLAQDEWRGREDLPDYFPAPEQTDKSLFFIQRNLNAHTIVYDLKLLEDGTLDKKEPIDNYWRQFASTGKRRELSWLESWLAYGYRAKMNKDSSYQIKLRAHKERYITLRKDQNRWRAVIQINGEESYLTNIYAYADESGILPDVKHVDLFGINIRTGQRVKERIYD